MQGNRWAYTAMMIIATVVAGLILRTQQRGLQLPWRLRLGILLGGLIGATTFAKWPFVWMADPAAGLGVWFSDGKTILWGLVGGYVGVEVAKWSLHVKTRTGDSFVVAIPIAIAIGRVGCLLFGCCYGQPTDLPWGVGFLTAPDGGTLLRHPTQAYEMIFHISAATIGWLAIQWRWQPGRLMPWYLVGYAVFRFVSEYWRPEPRLAGQLTFYQYSSIVIAIAFGVIIVYRSRALPQPDQ